MTETRFEYRSDELQPIDTDATDPFGHRDYANTVVAELRDFPKQFTLGLFGDWGSGKSTILEQVGKQLRADETTTTAFVLFDAWRYEGDSLRREFIRTVGESLEEQGALRRGFDFDRHIEAFETETTVSRRRLGFDPTAIRDGVIAAFLVAGIVAALIFVLPKLGLSRPTTLKVLIAISSAATAFILFALQRAAVSDPVQATRRRLEFPDQFASNFRELLDNVYVKRLVIAIDNLDRCSPARVTEVLSSIKTFLEPAFREEGTDGQRSWRARVMRVVPGVRDAKEDRLERMCFVVAADDAALRRHLTAQELSKEQWRGAAEDQVAELPAEVRTAVDEYLRKFFGASLRIRGLLDEDIRRFTGEELDKFNRSRSLSKELSRRLIEMTSQGLKRNPRRIKQFVNNLQLRLQMLAERKAQGRIQIDADVLVVAKLAIIEEEFVEEFEDLEKDPTLLATWHTQARVPLGEESAELSLKSEFASFLRFTDDIQPRDIRAYLNLKQTKSELDLPRYTEFVDLLDDGDVGRLGQLMQEEQGEEASYTDAARAHFIEQRKAGAWSRAHNTLRSIVEVPLLHGKNGRAAREVLEVSLQEPSLEARLGQLEPKTLLDVAMQVELAIPKLERIVGQVITALAAPETRHAASDALAGHVTGITEAGKQRIQEILTGEDVRTDFDSYLPLITALPEMLNHEIVDAALARVEELGTEGIATQNSAFAVAVEGLVRNNDAGRLERLLVLARAALEAYLGSSSDELGSVARELARVVETGQQTDAMSEFAGWLTANRDGIPASSRGEALRLALALCRGSDEADASAGAAAVDWLFELEDGANAVTWLSRNFDDLPANVRSRVTVVVSEALVGETRNLSEAQIEEVLTLFTRDEQGQINRSAVDQAIALERPEVAGSLLKRLGNDAQGQAIADALARAEGAPAGQIGDTKFVIAQRSRIGEAQLYQLAMKIAQLLFDDRGVVQQLAPELGRLELASAEQRLELVEHMIKTERDMSDAGNREAMLRAAWSAAGKRRSKARDAITKRLEEIKAAGEAGVSEVAEQLLNAS